MLSLLELSMEVESGLKTKKEFHRTTSKNGKVRELKGTWIDIHDSIIHHVKWFSDVFGGISNRKPRV